ncbi:MAG: hypothetical protein JRH20_20370 [Deltaproteobacteria bacterium]|nr:hypothetical protein [Deltaproteobacteria bacterium]
MTRESVLELLSEVGEGDGKRNVIFAEDKQVALLLALDGALVTVERLSRVELKGEYLVAYGAREQFLVAVEYVAGLRLTGDVGTTGFRA